MDVSVFFVIFNDFCSILWVLLYFIQGGGDFLRDTVYNIKYNGGRQANIWMHFYSC